MSPGLLNFSKKKRGEKIPNLEPVRFCLPSNDVSSSKNFTKEFTFTNEDDELVNDYLQDDPDTVDDDSNEFSVQLESFIALVVGCMSVIMELLRRFDLGFETSDFISGKLLTGYKPFSLAPWRGMLRGSCHFSIAPLYRFVEGSGCPLNAV